MFGWISKRFRSEDFAPAGGLSGRRHQRTGPIDFLAARPGLTLWIASATIIVGLSVLFVFEARTRYFATIADAGRMSQSFADILAEHTARTFEAVDRTLRVAESIRNDALAGHLTEQAANQALRGLQKSSPALLAIGWTNEAGNVVAHSYDGNAVRENIADLSHFIAQRDRETEGLYIAPLYRSKASQRWISAASLRLNNPDGSFAGVVTAPLDLSYFARIFQLVKLGSNDTVTLVRSDGTVLMRDPFSEGAVGKSYLNTNLFSKFLVSSEFGTFESRSPIDAIERMFAYRTVPGLPLIMLVTQDRAEVLARWSRRVRIFGSIVALFILVVFLGAIALSRQTRQLARESGLLAATLDNMHQGLLVVDQTDRIAIYNRRAMQLLDLPEAFLATHPLSKDVIAYQTGLGEFANLPDSAKPRLLPRMTGETENVYERERPNGTVLEIRTVPFANGGVIRTFKDITVWKRLERELSERESQFRLLAENATDIIARVSFDKVLLYISPSCAPILGYTADEMCGTKITDYIFEDDLARTVREFGKIVKYNPTGVHRIEYRVRHKAGHLVWLEANPKLLLDEFGTPMEIFDVIRDTTERKAIETQVELAKQQAENAAAAQAQFLATMSHELRTPLNSIIGFSDIVLHRNDLAPDVRRQIGLIQTASDSLLAVVNDVLDFSKIEEGKLELTPVEFDFRGLIQSVVEIVHGSAKAKNLELRVSVDERVAPRLVGDDQRICQILFNLLNNAIKFTRDGQVSLAVEIVAQNDVSERLRLSVSDTGIGIPENKFGDLFQRFRQIDSSTSREYGGSGLGLAISKRLVEMMGGEIGVESTLGKGSTFWVLLNLAKGGAQPAADAPFSPPTASDSARLLLVEDMEVNREIACAILRSMGYRVDAVPDGSDAVAAVQSSSYDLVLMDVQMPGMDGLTATKLIRALPGSVAAIPIVAMTANVLPKQIDAFRSAGMNGHIGKPFKRGELMATIERYISEAAQLSELASAPPTIDEQSIRTLTELLGAEKIDMLLDGLRAQLERFASFDAASVEPADLATLAHRLVSSAGMLGFSSVSKYCSRLESALSGDVQDGVTFEEVRDVCRAALAEISLRLSGPNDIPAAGVA